MIVSRYSRGMVVVVVVWGERYISDISLLATGGPRCEVGSIGRMIMVGMIDG